MAVTEQDIKHLEKLARLSFPEAERASLIKDLEGIIDFATELQSVDCPKDITINPLPIENRWREDEVVAGLTPEEALANAPDRLEDYLLVPAVIEVSDEL